MVFSAQHFFLHPTVQTYDSYVHHVIFSGYITNQFNDQLPVGFTGILEVRVRIESNSGKLDFLWLLAFLFSTA